MEHQLTGTNTIRKTPNRHRWRMSIEFAQFSRCIPYCDWRKRMARSWWNCSSTTKSCTSRPCRKFYCFQSTKRSEEFNVCTIFFFSYFHAQRAPVEPKHPLPIVQRRNVDDDGWIEAPPHVAHSRRPIERHRHNIERAVRIDAKKKKKTNLFTLLIIICNQSDIFIFSK